MKRYGAGPGPRARVPAGAPVEWHGATAYKVDLDRLTGEHTEWCFGQGLRALQAFRWMCGNLALANNRRQRRQGGATADALERAAAATEAARHAYANGDWPAFERALEHHQWSLTEARVAFMTPFALAGKASKEAASKREKDKDREDFKRIARDLLDAGVDRDAALAHPRLKPYVREYPDRSKVWLRDVYPKRGRGAPRKK